LQVNIIPNCVLNEQLPPVTHALLELNFFCVISEHLFYSIGITLNTRSI